MSSISKSAEQAGAKAPAKAPKLKSYDVIVRTTAEWYGTVQATSRADAKRLAEYEFNEGGLRQFGEEIEGIDIEEVRS